MVSQEAREGRDPKLTTKKKTRSKSIKRPAAPKLSPFQERLKETDGYILPIKDDVLSAPTAKDRLILVNNALPDHATEISRIWPLQLQNKDSRIRRELSEKGTKHFQKGEHDQVLYNYNKALMFSTGKGIAHTLARRAAFFLSTGDPHLALRDLSESMEYGCLQSELLDFLLSHHTPAANKQNQQMRGQYQWAEKVQNYLDAAANLKGNTKENKEAKENLLKNIMDSITSASKEFNIDTNLESEELEVPVITERNPLCPAFTEAAAISYDPDKGRMVTARRDIRAGELICVDSPLVSILCPENEDSIQSHCIHCFRFTRAPLPCDTCCTVVFCSKDCKKKAMTSYHKYECPMRLYELFKYEGRDVFGLFMTLRAITQKPVQYFSENQKELDKFLELSDPIHPHPGRSYDSNDYRTAVNLATHMEEVDDDVMQKHAILAVFFYRFLKFAGYFGPSGNPNTRGKNVPEIPSQELFILRLIHQLIFVQAFNSHSVHAMSDRFQWEKIGTSINPSMALINHSCDSNTVRCNINKSSILVAAGHIKQGEEITDSYTVHFRTSGHHERQYHCLKNYLFSCECPACSENWPLEDEVPDELPRIPNFDQEKIYKVRHGDKKDIVIEVVETRREVEKQMDAKNYKEALVAYQNLCERLEQHIRKPHIYYLQARSGITHCLWNLFCKPKNCNKADEQANGENAEESVVSRQGAKDIYKNAFTEKVAENGALDLGEPDVKEKESDERQGGSAEIRQLIENAKAAILNSVYNLTEVKESHEKTKKEVKDLKSQSKLHAELLSKHAELNQDLLEELALINEQAIVIEGSKNLDPGLISMLSKPSEQKQKDSENKRAQDFKEERKRRLDEQEKLLVLEAEERKRKREIAVAEKMKRFKEEETLQKEKKRQEDEEKRKLKEEQFNQKREAERKRFEEAKLKREMDKKKEDDELERLLMEMSEEDSADSGEVKDFKMKEQEQIAFNNFEIPSQQHNGVSESSKEVELETKQESQSESGEILTVTKTKVRSPSPIPSVKNDLQASKINNDPKLYELGNNVKPPRVSADIGPREESVWSAIREIKERNLIMPDFRSFSDKSAHMYNNISSNDLDNLISNVSNMITQQRTKPAITEEIEDSNSTGKNVNCNDVAKGSSDKDIDSKTEEISLETDKTEGPRNPFDFEKWSEQVNKLFQNSNEDDKVGFEKDIAYLESLKNRINEKIQNEMKKKKPETKPKTNDLVKETARKSTKENLSNDFLMLKMKDKDRKRKKREDKTKQTEEKLRDMARKTQKIEKFSVEAEEELKRMKERSLLLVQKSKMNEKDFDEIFASLKNETLKAKPKEAEERVQPINPHWTEDESNKWPQGSEEISVTNALSVIRAAALNKNLQPESLQGTMSSLKMLSEIPKAKAEDKVKVDSLPMASKLIKDTKSNKDSALIVNGSCKEESVKKNNISENSRKADDQKRPSQMQEKLSSAKASNAREPQVKSSSKTHEVICSSKEQGNAQTKSISSHEDKESEKSLSLEKEKMPCKSIEQKTENKLEKDSKLKEKVAINNKSESKDVKESADKSSLPTVKSNEKKPVSSKIIPDEKAKPTSLVDKAKPSTTTITKSSNLPSQDAVKGTELINQSQKKIENLNKIKEEKTIQKMSTGNPVTKIKFVKDDKETKAISSEKNLVKKIDFRPAQEDKITTGKDREKAVEATEKGSSINQKKEIDTSKIEETASISQAQEINSVNNEQRNTEHLSNLNNTNEPKNDIKENISNAKELEDNPNPLVSAKAGEGNVMEKKESSSSKDATNKLEKLNLKDSPCEKLQQDKLKECKENENNLVTEFAGVKIVQDSQKLRTKTDKKEVIKIDPVGDKKMMAKPTLKSNEKSKTSLSNPTGNGATSPFIKSPKIIEEKEETSEVNIKKHKVEIVHVVKTNTFLPKSNQNESKAIKMGTPSMVRKVVVNKQAAEVSVQKDSSSGSIKSYKVEQVPTEVVVIQAQPRQGSDTNYEISKIPTQNIAIKLNAKAQAEANANPPQAVTSSDARAAVKPPMPKSKPPPPPSFKPPPPPPC